MRPLILSLLLLASPAFAAPAVETSRQIAFFEKQVRPVLIEECGSCHGAKRQDGGLRLDSRTAILKGGHRGPLVKPGEPGASLLMRALSYRDPDLKMPPRGRLGERVLADLSRWVQEGAVWPGSGEPGGESAAPTIRRADASHWSLQPIRRMTPPRVRRRDWPANPIDAFVLARLEARGLAPAPAADRAALLRRLTYDLTGLPPKPAELDAFLADRRPDAYSRLVERLLDSPAYGERWGRHWLDVARYADSNGLDENLHYGNAWRYRDYVVDSFNRDTPFDRFLTEQIAGDLLPFPDETTRRRQAIATGFLSLGPKVLAEPDQRKMEMDIIDEQIDTLGRVFMGVTLGCARCHDHKFDPFSAEDYYALAGIFKSTKTMEHFKIIARWYEHPLPEAADVARKEEHDRKIASRKATIQAEIDAARAALLAAGKSAAEAVEAAFPEAVRTRLKTERDALAKLEKEVPEMPGAMGVSEGTAQSLPVHLRGSFLTLGKMVPRGFPAVLVGDKPAALPEKQSGRLELARWMADAAHPLTGRVIVNRVWRWHFGSGLVASPDNFGYLGERPSHPELLDWLASTFTTPASGGGLGWSVKALHRLIVNSSTYRMSSRDNPAARAADPENRLRWRFDVRRLEAEEIRDSLLSATGRLDPTMGGTLVTIKNREFFFDHTSKDGTKYDSRRRSLYLPVVRNHLYDVFQLFDYGDAQVPEGNRSTTTVAPQALFMLNSDLVRECAESLAEQALALAGIPDSGRLAHVTRAAWGRSPTPTESARYLEVLRRLQAAQPSGEPEPERRRKAWAWLCQSVLSSSEFLYLR